VFEDLAAAQAAVDAFRRELMFYDPDAGELAAHQAGPAHPKEVERLRSTGWGASLNTCPGHTHPANARTPAARPAPVWDRDMGETT
jgi:hypothetical protein